MTGYYPCDKLERVRLEEIRIPHQSQAALLTHVGYSLCATRPALDYLHLFIRRFRKDVDSCSTI